MFQMESDLGNLAIALLKERKDIFIIINIVLTTSVIFIIIAIFYVSDGVQFRELSYSIVEGEKGQIKLSQLYYCDTPLSVVLSTSDGTAYGKCDYVILY